MSALPEHDRLSASGSNESPQRLTRIQQLTLNTWRRAFAKVGREVSPNDVLAQVAIWAVLATLRDVTQPLSLFVRHATVAEEFDLVSSLTAPDRSRDEMHDLLDSAFLLRWLEMTRNGRGPEELPPLTRRFGH